MIELRVRPDDMVEPGNAPIPEIGADNGSPHVQGLIGGAAVDQDCLAVRQFDDTGISLPDIQKRHAQSLAVSGNAWRPAPPTQHQGDTHKTGSPQPATSFRPDRDGQHRIEGRHGKEGRRRHMPLGPRHKGQEVHEASHQVQQELVEQAERQGLLARQQDPDGRTQS